MSEDADLERRTRRLGEELLEGIQADGTGWLKGVEDSLLGWTMEHSSLKTPLFRLVDVLPALAEDADVIDHLRAYFHPHADADRDLPRPLRWLLRGSGTTWVPDTAAASLARHAVRRLARRFIAAESVRELTGELQGLLDAGAGVSVDRLGEAVLTPGEVEDYVREYETLFDHLPKLDTDGHSLDRPLSISLKPTALDDQFDPLAREATLSRLRERLVPLLDRAADQGVIVYLDMEEDRTREITLDLAERLLASGDVPEGILGVVIQAYHRDASRDVDRLLEVLEAHDAAVWVRLVKGAYWDVERVQAVHNQWPSPVFESKGRTDHQFERLARRLVEAHPMVRPAFGSHNVRSLARGIALARAANLPHSEWECQMLYGMGKPVRRTLLERDVPLRLYVPYGPLVPGMAYLVRRLLENTANESFLRRTFHEGVSTEELMAPPQPGDETASELEPGGYRTVGPTDFGRREAIGPQWEALRAVRDRLGETWTRSRAGAPETEGPLITSRNPSRWDQVVGRVHGIEPGPKLEAALDSAREVFPDWRDVAAEQRAGWLERLGERLEDRRRELAAWMILEAGKNWREADADVMEAVDFCRYYAGRMRDMAEGRRMDWPGEQNRLEHEPRGPAAVIPPWNFPLAITTGMAVAALVTGNPVLLKPSSQTPVIAARLVEEAHAAGLPEGVLQFLPGEGSSVGRALVEDPRVAQVAFTGSREVGTSIYETIGKLREGQRHLKTCVLEMGGKNAIIVDRDADPDRAVEGVLKSAFGYQGQKCSACSRLILIESEPGEQDGFVDRLVEAARGLRLGPADRPENFMGPLISPGARQGVESYRQLASREGEVVLDANLPAGLPEGPYVAPMIVDHVDRDGRLAREEVFGPLLSVFRVSSLDEALRLALDVDYALTGGFYSRHPERIERVKREFRVGNLYVNRSITGALVGRQPFGGYRLSGTGTKAGGPDYLKNFTWPRSTCENTTRRGFAPDVIE